MLGERLRPLAGRGARLPRRPDPGRRRHRRAARALERHATGPDKGRAFFLELAAKQVAIARGLGFRGAYIGGHLKLGDYDAILEQADSFGPDDWRDFAREIQFPYPDEFHYFERDEATGLSSTRSTARTGVDDQEGPAQAAATRVARVPVQPSCPRRGIRARTRRSSARAGRSSGRSTAGRGRSGRPLHVLEQARRCRSSAARTAATARCPDIAYLCPESQCVKNQRNGPCGGTREGLCEIGEKECIWALAYDRLKAYGEEEDMLDGPAILKDNGAAGHERLGEHVPRARPPRGCEREEGR